MSRKLGSDEEALWARVAATVRPLRARPLVAPRAGQARAIPASRPAPKSLPPPQPARSARAQNANTLDASWDRRLSRGLVQPDMVIDLHGLSLAAAHSLLETRLGQAIADGDRLILLVTGKAPHPERRPEGRGAIRASVAGWLSASVHAPRIAAVRGAHPRHGGAGALYVVLRRHRDGYRQNS